MKIIKFYQKINEQFKKLIGTKPFITLTFLLTGLFSTIWFLARVIPKPSRATYPCMKAAAPIMSGFVIYLLALTGSFFAFRKFRKNWSSAKYIAASSFFIIAVTLFFLAQTSTSKEIKASDLVSPDYFAANAPIGEAKGYKPGRVVWAWDQNATPQDFIPANKQTQWWAKQTDGDVVDKMLVNAVCAYTNNTSVKNAWTEMFKYFNKQHGKGEVSYTKGEKIYIKVNLTNSDQGGALSGTTKTGNFQRMDATPELMLALLKQLIEEVGVAQEDIYMGDPFRTFHDLYWDVCHSVYPNVVYCDGKGKNGRHQTVPTSEHQLIFSDGKREYRIPQEYVESEYFINLPCLKTHDAAGITLGAKNHQGSILQDGAGSSSQSAYDMHYALPDHDDNGVGHHRYRHLVDYLAHEHLGGKTLVTIIDGIWAGRSWEGFVEKWESAPFNGDYPNSIFISQDLVAIDAVCFDFLLEEYNDRDDREKYAYLEGADDYLYQAADPANWASGVDYDPEGDGTTVGSLGVYEHWNNATEKKYSRNLGTGNGIELVAITPANYLTSTPVKPEENSLSLVVFPTQVVNELNFSFNQITPGSVSTEILSLDGKQISKQKKTYYQKGTLEQKIDVTHLSSGLYLLNVNIESEGGKTIRSTTKFQKQ